MAWVRPEWILVAYIASGLTSAAGVAVKQDSHFYGNLRDQPEDYDPISHPNWGLFDTKACGLSTSDRIVGGYTTALGAYPWLARLGYITIFTTHVEALTGKRRLLPVFRCGGALITHHYVITAAHCAIKDPRLSLEVIRLGEWDVTTDPDCSKNVCADRVKDYPIAEIVPHQNYNKPDYKNDVCLIRTDKDIVFTMFVRPICMIHGSLLNKSYVSEIAEVAGWGIVDTTTRVTSKNLQALKIHVQDLDLCEERFNAYASLGDTQLCAGGQYGKDSCSGDSGGPLMKIDAVGDQAPRYYIIGIVSFGAKECAVSDAPAIYTSLGHFILWVLDHMRP